MKKFLVLLLSIVLCVCGLSFSACGKKENKELKVYVPDGAPALAIAKFMADEEDFDTGLKVNYQVVSASDIGGYVTKGTGDIVVLPVNLASKLYKDNVKDPYKMVSVITHGNLYLISGEELTIEDLAEKKVGVIGRGAVPDMTLRIVLNAQGIEKTEDTFTYYQDGTAAKSALEEGVIDVALLPEPVASVLTRSTEKAWYRLDLQELYEAETKEYPQAVMLVKNSVLEKYENLVETISASFVANLTWVKENSLDAVSAVNSHLKEGLAPSLKAPMINASVIDNCKISWRSAVEAKQTVNKYLGEIRTINPSGAAVVSDDFFYAE